MKDLRTGKTLAEAIERVGSVVWATDNKTLFYTTEDAVSKRSDKFWRHAVGATGSDLLYEEKDELFDVGAGALARQEDDLPRQLRQDVDARSATCRPTRRRPACKVILPREAGHEYDVDHHDGQFYITTNKGAKNFRVVTAPMTTRRRRTGRPSSSTTRRSRSTASPSSPITSSSRNARAV